MSTKSDIARGYAARILAVTRAQSYTRLEKAVCVNQLGQVLSGIFGDLDGLVCEGGSQRISDQDKERILAEVDAILALSTGTLGEIRKGSILQTINYQQMVTDLYGQIMRG